MQAELDVAAAATEQTKQARSLRIAGKGEQVQYTLVGRFVAQGQLPAISVATLCDDLAHLIRGQAAHGGSGIATTDQHMAEEGREPACT